MAFDGLRVVSFESRRATEMAELIRRQGGDPFVAPSMREAPIENNPEAFEFAERLFRGDFDLMIFLTGVGTRALFQATDAAQLTGELLQHLSASLVAVRGPKPVGELNAREVRIDIRAATPFTTDTVLAAVSDRPLRDARVLVQRYGAANHPLREALEARGASVQEIATYRWALPADTRPLNALLDALARSAVDAVVFTSAVQIHNLYAVAQSAGRASALAGQLNGLVIASIGPVCSRALREHGVTPSFEANPPKLGPLVAALDAALSAHR